MASRFSISAVFKAIDMMTAPINRMTGNTRRASRVMRADFAKANRQVDSFRRSIGPALRTAAFVGIAAVGAGIGLVTREFIKLDQTLVGANARFIDTQIGTEQAAQNLAALKAAAREAGATTQFTAVQAAEGLNFYAKAGFTSAEAIGVLKDTIDLATASESDFSRAADISSDLLGSFGLNVQDSAQKIENLTALNRALGLTSNAANVKLEDMFETLKIAAPIATQAGEQMNELMAITGALGSAGIKGSMAATALKNAYIRLAAPTSEVNKALESVNLSQKDFIDSEGKLKSMTDIMQILGNATTDLTQIQQLGLFSEIFGARAVAGATNLSKSLADVDLIMQKLESDVKLSDIADEIRKGLGMQIDILGSSLLELGLKFVEAFEDEGRGALSNLIEAVQNFDLTPIINTIKDVAGFIGKVIEVVEFLWPLIKGIGGAWLFYKGAMLAAAAAQTVINAVMSASPVGIIITAIGALIGIILLLQAHWDEVVKFFKDTGEKIGAFFAGVWEGIKTGFIAAFNVIKHVLFTVVDVIFTIFGEVTKAIVGVAADVGGALGLDVTELRKTIDSIDAIQAAIRSESYIGGTPTQAPVSPAERSSIIRQETNSTGELLIRDETGRAEMTRNPGRGGYQVRLEQSGAF